MLRRITADTCAPGISIHGADPARTELLARLPPLQKGYRPTPWLSNAHMQIFWMETSKNWGFVGEYDHHEQIIMADGGITALAWMGYHLPEKVPTIVLLHTITGSPHTMRQTASDLHEATGWRIVVCVRRGHAGLSLPVPKLNIMGCLQDATGQIRLIHNRLPASPLYGLGISAGSGLLIRYMAQQDVPQFEASFAYAPGYDTDIAFDRVQPLYSRVMAWRLYQHFIQPHLEEFAGFKTLPRLKVARSIAQFHRAMYEISGFDSLEDYARDCNPMHVFDRLTRPMMILSACDDPLCRIENAIPYLDSISEMPNLTLVATRHGSHCGYFENRKRPRSWANQLIAAYFLQQAGQPPLRRHPTPRNILPDDRLTA